MIFVTVGTHEQPFNRLIKAVDSLCAAGIITEPVMIQTGFSTYEPKHCKWRKFLPYTEMKSNVKKARIVISHGGPASFLMPLQFGKIPIVVPRQLKFDEHVNDHQMEFTEFVAKKQDNIIPVYDIQSLGEVIQSYSELTSHMQNHGASSNNAHFNKEFASVVSSLLA